MGCSRKSRVSSILKIIIILGVLTAFTGCTAYNDAKAKVTGYYPFGKEDVLNATNETVVTCPVPAFQQPDKVSYFFNNHKEGLLKFMDHSDDFLYCAFGALSNRDIAKKLVRISKDSDVILKFDLKSSFENCNVACIPREDSQYNFLVSENLNSLTSDFKDSFCVSEDGVMFWSGNFDNYGVSESHIFWGESLSKTYKEYYQNI